MSRFTIKRSLKQLYIEKHAVEHLITHKKSVTNVDEMTTQQISDLIAEEALLKEIVNSIKFAEQKIKKGFAEG